METEFFKMEIFIPPSHFDQLQKTLQAVDAGHIGKYDSCLSYTRVTGTWRPLEGANPHIGETNVLSEEEELKVEVTVKRENLKGTVAAIRQIHPYEEPVINVIPLYMVGI